MVLLLHPDAPLDLTRFSIHWSTVAGIAGLAALWQWRRTKRPEGSTDASPLAFYTALALLFFSLNGPLHDLSDRYLFSAHMVQHLVLTMAVIPLLIIGTPGWMLRPALRSRIVSTIARTFTRPIVAYAVFNIAMIAWHLPPLYNLAMADHDVHVLQHLVFLGSATLVWWPLLSPLPELPPLSHALRMLYVVLLMIPMNVIGLMITYADEVLYPAYESAPRLTTLSPMDDQLVGGLIMWIPGTFILIGVATALFFRWVKVEEAHG